MVKVNTYNATNMVYSIFAFNSLFTNHASSREVTHISLPQAVDLTFPVLQPCNVKSVILIIWQYSDNIICFNFIKMNDLLYDVLLGTQISSQNAKYS